MREDETGDGVGRPGSSRRARDPAAGPGRRRPAPHDLGLGDRGAGGSGRARGGRAGRRAASSGSSRDKVAVPDLAGMTSAEAKEALTAAGLEPDRARRAPAPTAASGQGRAARTRRPNADGQRGLTRSTYQSALGPGQRQVPQRDRPQPGRRRGRAHAERAWSPSSKRSTARSRRTGGRRSTRRPAAAVDEGTDDHAVRSRRATCSVVPERGRPELSEDDGRGAARRPPASTSTDQAVHAEHERPGQGRHGAAAGPGGRRRSATRRKTNVERSSASTSTRPRPDEPPATVGRTAGGRRADPATPAGRLRRSASRRGRRPQVAGRGGSACDSGRRRSGEGGDGGGPRPRRPAPGRGPAPRVARRRPASWPA